MKFNRGFKTKDAALSYYVNQLENLDPKLHEPLVSVSWGRDIKLRPGITLGDEATSYLRSTYSGVGTLQNNSGNFPWISAETTAIPGVTINGQKVILPMRLLAREVSFTSPELARSQKLGQPIDTQKIDALNMLYQMNTDQMVYIGEAGVGATGLLNDPGVTVTIAPNGVSGYNNWARKTPAEILADINTALVASWTASAFARMPVKIGLPPAQFAYLAATIVTTAGNNSILKYLQDNNIATLTNGSALSIVPMKWLIGAGTSGTDRMIVYSDSVDCVRFPMVPIQRETAYYSGIRFIAPYLWAYGQVEFIYPETAAYVDGI